MWLDKTAVPPSNILESDESPGEPAFIQKVLTITIHIRYKWGSLLFFVEGDLLNWGGNYFLSRVDLLKLRGELSFVEG